MPTYEILIQSTDGKKSESFDYPKGNFEFIDTEVYVFLRSILRVDRKTAIKACNWCETAQPDEDYETDKFTIDITEVW